MTFFACLLHLSHWSHSQQKTCNEENVMISVTSSAYFMHVSLQSKIDLNLATNAVGHTCEHGDMSCDVPQYVYQKQIIKATNLVICETESSIIFKLHGQSTHCTTLEQIVVSHMHGGLLAALVPHLCALH
jgi:hypothetical protein